MKKMRQWLALALSVLMLADCVPAYGAQVDATGDEVINNTDDVVDTDQDNAENAEEEQWYNYYIDFENYYYTLTPGKTVQLVVDTDAPMGELVYESSDPTVATVSRTGLVTAINAGTAGEKSVTVKVSWTNPENPDNTWYDTCTVYVSNTISLNETEYTVYTGQNTTYRLKAQTNPKGTVTWKSSKTSVATVDQSGKITPKKAGTTVITATANGVSAQCEVTVKKPSFTMDSKATAYVKNRITLNAVASPGKAIKWTSSNKAVATVSSKGVVTGKKKGTVTITAKVHGITRKCKVTVVDPSISISINGYSSWFSKTTAMFAGSTIQMYANSQPSTAKVTWTSSNKKVAKVDKNGQVTGVKPGTATITASIPGAKATYNVIVRKNAYELNATGRTLMVGNTATLYVKGLSGSSPAFGTRDNTGCVTLSSEGNQCVVKASQKGKEVVEVSFWQYTEGYMTKWSRNCTIQVVDTGISDQQFSVAKSKTKQLKLVNVGDAGTIASIAWKSSAPKIASIDTKTGLVKGVKEGSAKITATVTYVNGKKKSYSTQMKVSNPKLKASTVVAALNGNKTIELKGINAYSNITWKTNKKSIATVSADGTIVPKKKGQATITVNADGVTLKCTVYVSNPTLAADYVALAPGGSSQIQLTGLAAKSKVTYKSSNTGVATVGKSGKVTAHSGGRSEITVNADGKEFTYLVEVASQTALNARVEGKLIIDRSTYSQPLRMTEGYYDCSSLVFRAYGRNSALLGGGYSWAPTAAGMAEHMVKTGKVISWGPVDVEDLRPGDLLFKGGQSNGRYLGIYHVSMYHGNGLQLEKPMQSYYKDSRIVMVARPAP